MNELVDETRREKNRNENGPALERVGGGTARSEGERRGLERGDGGTDVWTIAALAHASVLLTLVLASAGGVGALVGLVVPLVIYLSYRERSRFVAFHALQALIYQGAGILIYLALVVILVLAVTVAWTISGLLSVVVVGLLLMPLALVITALMLVVLLGAPLVWLAYALYAAYQVYQGSNFRYWLIGEWVEGEVKI